MVWVMFWSKISFSDRLPRFQALGRSESTSSGRNHPHTRPRHRLSRLPSSKGWICCEKLDFHKNRKKQENLEKLITPRYGPGTILER